MNPKVHSKGKMYLIYILKTNITYCVIRVLNKPLKLSYHETNTIAQTTFKLYNTVYAYPTLTKTQLYKEYFNTHNLSLISLTITLFTTEPNTIYNHLRKLLSPFVITIPFTKVIK